VRPVDLVLLAGFYMACGLGITVGFHRLLRDVYEDPLVRGMGTPAV
jgi:hypothetical protein